VIEHIAMVFAADGMTASEKHLLSAYCDHTDAHGYCWPGIKRLAHKTGMNPRTVQRTNASLKKKNLINSIRRVNPRTGDPITNLTRVNLPLLASMRRPDEVYDDDLIEEITFPENGAIHKDDTQSDLLIRQNVATPPAGCRPNPQGNPSGEPVFESAEQPPPPTSSAPSLSERDGERGQEREEEASSTKSTDSEALALVDQAAARWTRRPTDEERARIAGLVAQALADGATPAGIIHGLTRDLETARNPVAVVTSRARNTKWADHDPAAIAAEAAKPKLPPHCGDHRCRGGWLEDDDHDAPPRRCSSWPHQTTLAV